jgi:hypothetical protein
MLSVIIININDSIQLYNNSNNSKSNRREDNRRERDIGWERRERRREVYPEPGVWCGLAILSCLSL